MVALKRRIEEVYVPGSATHYAPEVFESFGGVDVKCSSSPLEWLVSGGKRSRVLSEEGQTVLGMPLRTQILQTEQLLGDPFKLVAEAIELMRSQHGTCVKQWLSTVNLRLTNRCTGLMEAPPQTAMPNVAVIFGEPSEKRDTWHSCCMVGDKLIVRDGWTHSCYRAVSALPDGVYFVGGELSRKFMDSFFDVSIPSWTLLGQVPKGLGGKAKLPVNMFVCARDALELVEHPEICKMVTGSKRFHPVKHAVALAAACMPQPAVAAFNQTGARKGVAVRFKRVAKTLPPVPCPERKEGETLIDYADRIPDGCSESSLVAALGKANCARGGRVTNLLRSAFGRTTVLVVLE